MTKDKTYIHFYNALKKRQHHRIKSYILNDGVDPSYQFADGSCPIHIAAAQNDLKVLNLLLSLKVLKDVKDRSGQTALMIGLEDAEVVRTLLSYGCNTEICDKWKRTALHLSAGKGLLATSQLLLDFKASVNNIDKDKRTPLHIAIINTPKENGENFMEIISLLIKSGAHLDRSDKFCDTPLCLAVRSGIPDIVELLINNGVDVNKPGRRRTAPLLYAVMEGKSAMVELLIQQNCNVNIENPITHKSCLQTAIEKGYIDIVKILVAAGTQIYNEKLMQLLAAPTMEDSMREYLSSLISEPQKLRELCRGYVRQLLGSNIEKKLQKLKYPQILKNFILLNDTTHLYYADAV